jgi:hypothetical protein
MLARSLLTSTPCWALLFVLWMGVRLPGSFESFEGGFIHRRELGNLVQSGDVFWFLVLPVKSRPSVKTLRETLGGWGCLVRGPFLFM